jgi:voltage-gated sodium channel
METSPAIMVVGSDHPGARPGLPCGLRGGDRREARRVRPAVLPVGLEHLRLRHRRHFACARGADLQRSARAPGARLLRVLSVAPRLRRVVEGFITALPGMGSVFLLMAIIFYIGAVMATKLFAASFPDWFGDLGRSAYSLFQIMTLESWSMGIVRPVMEVYPYAWAFFVPFIMVTTFAVVNLLVGLIVNSMQEAHGAEENERTDAYRDEVLARLKAIEARLEERERERA